MSPNDADLPQIYLKAGEIVFSDKPHITLTVLGSCLSVTMLHRPGGLSAISHGLLPHCRERAACSGDCKQMAKYVECSIVWMLKRFTEAGVPPRELEVKVFGGADMFTTRSVEKGVISVGKQNIAVAQKIIESEGLTVVSMDVGGNQGRKIFFNTQTGEVMLKRLMPNVILVDPGEKK
jgi:chemotaxis protein CheD